MSDMLNGALRSTSKPTEFWDLEEDGIYHATLSTVGVSWLYANFYFSPNDDGRIYVDFDDLDPKTKERAEAGHAVSELTSIVVIVK
ncbi:hypothetical protein [Paradesulfitobacterium aromaticivorans]